MFARGPVDRVVPNERSPVPSGDCSLWRTHGPWTFFHEERALGDPVPPGLKHWKPHGIIVRLTGAKLIRQVRRMKTPAVDLYREDETADIPGVAIDQNALIRMAVGHFWERGFKNFAYCGFTNVLFSELRHELLRQAPCRARFAGTGLLLPGAAAAAGLAAIEAHALQYADQLIDWIGRQPKPLALLACNDERAQQALTLCRQAGIAVPDQVAVLGVDNDDVECELCDPPLSSIDPNCEQIGYQAAALLDRMMKGKAPPPSRILVPALCVVARRSTDALAVDDPDAAEAIRFVREHACQRHPDRGRHEARERVSQHRAAMVRETLGAFSRRRNCAGASAAHSGIAPRHQHDLGGDRLLHRVRARRVDAADVQADGRHDAGPIPQTGPPPRVTYSVIKNATHGHCRRQRRRPYWTLLAVPPAFQALVEWGLGLPRM